MNAEGRPPENRRRTGRMVRELLLAALLQAIVWFASPLAPLPVHADDPLTVFDDLATADDSATYAEERPSSPYAGREPAPPPQPFVQEILLLGGLDAPPSLARTMPPRDARRILLAAMEQALAEAESLARKGGERSELEKLERMIAYFLALHGSVDSASPEGNIPQAGASLEELIAMLRRVLDEEWSSPRPYRCRRLLCRMLGERTGGVPAGSDAGPSSGARDSTVGALVRRLLRAAGLLGRPPASGPSISGAASETGGGTRIRVFFNYPPSSLGIDERLIRLLGMAEGGGHYGIAPVMAHFYQVNRIPVARAFSLAARRLGPGSVLFFTDDDYLHYALHHRLDGEHGSAGEYVNAAAYEKAYSLLRDAGIEVRSDTYGGADGRGQSHNKFCVVNGEYVWTGSYNITDNGTTRNFNNALLIRSRALARAYADEFLRIYSGSFGKRKKSHGTRLFYIDRTRVELRFSPWEGTNEFILSFVEKSRRTLDVAMFTLTSRPIVNALCLAARRGVEVRVLLEGLSSTFSAEWEEGVRCSVVDRLVSNGVEVKVCRVAGLLHHKFAVRDAAEPWAAVLTGSHNWTAGADTVNDENVLAIRSTRICDAYETMFERMWNDPRVAYPPPPLKRAAPLSEVLPDPPVRDGGGETVRIAAFSFRGSDWVALANDGADGVALGGWRLVADRRPLVVLPAITLEPRRAVVLNGPPRIVEELEKTLGRKVERVEVRRFNLSATDEALKLQDRYGITRDAAVWSNRDGRFTRGEDSDLVRLISGSRWCGTLSGPPREEWALDSSRPGRKDYLVRRLVMEGTLVDTDSPSDWILIHPDRNR